MIYFINIMVGLLGFVVLRRFSTDSRISYAASWPFGAFILGTLTLLALLMGIDPAVSVYLVCALIVAFLWHDGLVHPFYIAGIGVLTLLIEMTKISVFTHDSQTMLVLGRSLFMEPGLHSEFIRQASSMGPLSMILMGFSYFMERDLWDSLTPLLMISLFWTYLELSRKPFLNCRGLWLSMAFLGLSPMVLMFFFYTHSNPVAGVFFSLSLGFFWLATTIKAPWAEKVSVLFLLGYALTRIEGPVFWSMSVFFYALKSSSLRNLWPIVGVSSILLGVWNTHVYLNLGKGIEGFSNSNQSLVLIFASLLPLAMPILWAKRSLWQRYGATLATALFLALNLAMALLKPGFILGGAYYVSTVLFDIRYWGLFWIAVVPAGLWSVKRARPEDFFWGHLIVNYFLIISALGYFREITYQPFWADSAVRMSFHIAPFFCLYLTKVYVQRFDIFSEKTL